MSRLSPCWLFVGLAACAEAPPPSASTPPAATAATSSEIAHPLGGKPVPTFKRRTLANAEVDTGALRGRVAVIKFFAKYCEPCKRTLPAIERLSHENPNVTVIGVAEDESAEDALALVSTYRLSFAVVHDGAQTLGGRFRVRELPITFVVNKAGVIASVLGPEADEDGLRAAIKRADTPPM